MDGPMPRLIFHPTPSPRSVSSCQHVMACDTAPIVLQSEQLCSSIISYTRPRLLLLCQSPLVKPPDGIPPLREWFGIENESNISRKESDPLITRHLSRDRRLLRRELEDKDMCHLPQMGHFRHPLGGTKDASRSREAEGKSPSSKIDPRTFINSGSERCTNGRPGDPFGTNKELISENEGGQLPDDMVDKDSLGTPRMTHACRLDSRTTKREKDIRDDWRRSQFNAGDTSAEHNKDRFTSSLARAHWHDLDSTISADCRRWKSSSRKAEYSQQPPPKASRDDQDREYHSRNPKRIAGCDKRQASRTSPNDIACQYDQEGGKQPEWMNASVSPPSSEPSRYGVGGLEEVPVSKKAQTRMAIELVNLSNGASCEQSLVDVQLDEIQLFRLMMKKEQTREKFLSQPDILNHSAEPVPLSSVSLPSSDLAGTLNSVEVTKATAPVSVDTMESNISTSLAKAMSANAANISAIRLGTPAVCGIPDFSQTYIHHTSVRTSKHRSGVKVMPLVVNNDKDTEQRHQSDVGESGRLDASTMKFVELHPTPVDKSTMPGLAIAKGSRFAKFFDNKRTVEGEPQLEMTTKMLAIRQALPQEPVIPGAQVNDAPIKNTPDDSGMRSSIMVNKKEWNLQAVTSNTSLLLDGSESHSSTPRFNLETSRHLQANMASAQSNLATWPRNQIYSSSNIQQRFSNECPLAPMDRLETHRWHAHQNHAHYSTSSKGPSAERSPSHSGLPATTAAAAPLSREEAALQYAPVEPSYALTAEASRADGQIYEQSPYPPASRNSHHVQFVSQGIPQSPRHIPQHRHDYFSNRQSTVQTIRDIQQSPQILSQDLIPSRSFNHSNHNLMALLMGKTNGAL